MAVKAGAKMAKLIKLATSVVRVMRGLGIPEGNGRVMLMDVHHLQTDKIRSGWV